MLRLIVAGGTAVVLLVVGEGRGDVRYSVLDLGAVVAIDAHAIGLNNAGQVVGTAGGRAFLYSPANGIQDFNLLVAPPSAGLTLTPTAINNNGQIVGTVSGITGPHDSDVFLSGGSGQATLIPNSLGNSSELLTASAINDNAQVVGFAVPSAYLYRNSGGVKDLGKLTGGDYSEADAINSGGQVVGYSSTTNGGFYHYAAFVYSGNGPMQDLNSLVAPGSGWTLQWALGINDTGQIVGGGVLNGPGGASPRSFLYSGGHVQDLGTLGGTGVSSGAMDINNKGQVVGWADASVNQEHAFIYSGNGPMQDLNDLIAPLPGVTLQEATAINDNGQIIAFSSPAYGPPSHAFLLTPIPEPSTPALLGTGAIGLMACACRRIGRNLKGGVK